MVRCARTMGFCGFGLKRTLTPSKENKFLCQLKNCSKSGQGCHSQIIGVTALPYVHSAFEKGKLPQTANSILQF